MLSACTRLNQSVLVLSNSTTSIDASMEIEDYQLSVVAAAIYGIKLLAPNFYERRLASLSSQLLARFRPPQE